MLWPGLSVHGHAGRDLEPCSPDGDHIFMGRGCVPGASPSAHRWPEISLHLGLFAAKKGSETERKMTSPGRVADGPPRTLLHEGVPRNRGHPSYLPHHGWTRWWKWVGGCISGEQLSRGLLGSSGLFLPGPQAAWNCHCTFSRDWGLYKLGRL